MISGRGMSSTECCVLSAKITHYSYKSLLLLNNALANYCVNLVLLSSQLNLLSQGESSAFGTGNRRNRLALNTVFYFWRFLEQYVRRQCLAILVSRSGHACRLAVCLGPRGHDGGLQ